jgi:hypothetical protein
LFVIVAPLGPDIPSFHFFLDESAEFFFRSEEDIDLFGGKDPHEQAIVLFPDIQQGLVQVNLILIASLRILPGLAEFSGILVVEGPETLGFIGIEVHFFSDVRDLKGLQAVTILCLDGACCQNKKSIQ